MLNSGLLVKEQREHVTGIFIAVLLLLLLALKYE